MTPKEYVQNVCKTESVDFDKIAHRLQNPGTIRLLHGVMGLETEVGEFMDALKKHIFYGAGLDTVNLQEEMGDLFWYLGILADTLSVPFEDIWEKNIAKLKARYGDKFSETKAEGRDLDRERKILEGREYLTRVSAPADPDAQEQEVPAKLTVIHSAEEVEGNPVKDSYPDGVCPDCVEDIDDDVKDGDACPNCGHVFWLAKKEDDRKVYVLSRKKDESEYHQKYVLIPFRVLKKGDIFVITKVDGTPIPNLDGSVTSVALRDAHTDSEGEWGIHCESIVAHYNEGCETCADQERINAQIDPDVAGYGEDNDG